MDRIIDYKLLHAKNAEELTAQVTKDLADGWQPYGPPLAAAGAQLVQAMVRNDVTPSDLAGRAAEQLLAGEGPAMDTAETQIISRGRNLTSQSE